MFGVNVESKHIVNRIKENTIGVELGVWKGSSSEKFAKKTKHLHLVDAWAPESYQVSKEHGTFDDYLERYSKLVGSKNPEDFVKFYDKIYNEVKSKFAGLPVTIHRMSTDDFFKSFNEKVDWVYVDAAHDYEGCLKDLRNSISILNKNGTIYGDDYLNKPGVKAAVDQFVKETGYTLNLVYGSQYEITITSEYN
jgi:hypothetical protein